MIKLTLLDGTDIWVNLDRVLTISHDRGGSRLVLEHGGSITVKQKPADLKPVSEAANL